MRVLVDAQLPPALAQLLREHGHEAEHVTDIGPADVSDSDLWRYALEHDAAIVTKDEDFADLVATGREAPPVVWVRIGNTRRAALLAWIEPLIDQIDAMIDTAPDRAQMSRLARRPSPDGASRSAESCLAGRPVISADGRA